jgi:hypothetical protein
MSETIFTHTTAFVSVSLKKGQQIVSAGFSVQFCKCCELLEELSGQSDGKNSAFEEKI